MSIMQTDSDELHDMNDMNDAGHIGKLWAGNMLGTLNTNAPAETVMQAWFDAGSKAYTAGETNHLVITFRVAGWPDAFSEHLSDVNNTPGTGNPADITKQDQTVFNNP